MNLKGVAAIAFAMVSLTSCAPEPAFASDGPIQFFLSQDTKPRHSRGVAEVSSQIVRASYYGGGEHLQRNTASGERFFPLGMTIALRSRDFGHHYIVTLNRRSIIVRHNDIGPAENTGRSADLSFGAAKAIGLDRLGVAIVSIKRLD